MQSFYDSVLMWFSLTHYTKFKFKLLISLINGKSSPVYNACQLMCTLCFFLLSTSVKLLNLMQVLRQLCILMHFSDGK